MRPKIPLSIVILALPLLFPIRAEAQSRPASAGGAIARAERAAREVESLRADPAVDSALRANPQLTRRLHQADARLALARDALSAGRSPYRFGEAQEFAIAAEREYREVTKALLALTQKGDGSGGDEAARAALRAEVRAIARDVRELLERPYPSTEGVLERRAALVQALRAVRQLDDATPLERLRELRDRLVTAERALRDQLALGPPPAVLGSKPAPGAGTKASATPPPAELREAVSAFFSGDYAGTVALLATPNFGEAQATKVAYLLRGAALFYLWVESGERDQALLERAKADVRACRSVDPTFQVDRVAFSPRFAELFASLP